LVFAHNVRTIRLTDSREERATDCHHRSIGIQISTKPFPVCRLKSLP
jgi:hypothetical protein